MSVYLLYGTYYMVVVKEADFGAEGFWFESTSCQLTVPLRCSGHGTVLTHCSPGA